MKKIYFEPVQYFNQETSEFVDLKGGLFAFENSLKAISKWESKWKVPYFKDGEKTAAQNLDYMLCMCMSNGLTLSHLLTHPNQIKELQRYIEDSHTATTIYSKGSNNTTKRQVLSSEVIYAQMAIKNIPFECDKWNIHNLLMVISCVDYFTNPSKKKRSQQEIVNDWAALNEKRLKQYNTNG